MSKTNNKKEEVSKNVNVMPWGEKDYEQLFQILKHNCKGLVFHKEFPIDCPTNFENVKYSFVCSIPTMVDVPRITGLVKPAIFNRLFIGSIIVPPKYEEIACYNNPSEIEFLGFWNRQVESKKEKYYLLKEYAKKHNIITFEALYINDILEKILDLYSYREI